MYERLFTGVLAAPGRRRLGPFEFFVDLSDGTRNNVALFEALRLPLLTFARWSVRPGHREREPAFLIAIARSICPTACRLELLLLQLLGWLLLQAWPPCRRRRLPQPYGPLHDTDTGSQHDARHLQ